MRVFSCDNCGQTVYFENVVCENCGTALGIDPSDLTMQNLRPSADGSLITAQRRPRTYCGNYEYQVCNWLVPIERKGELCLSCGLNRTIPDLTVPGNVERWFEFEKAKRRLIYQLLKLGLPVKHAGQQNGIAPLVFDILADARTGHDNGVITLNVAEADPAIRERAREQMNEPYRTLLGHFRHEIGHYYWFALVNNNDRWLPGFRKLFGDDSADYGAALAAYHQNGPKPDWAQSYISAYATAHPWEDWAESWAHYMHMVDALDTAANYQILPRTNKGKARRSWFAPAAPEDPYRASARSLIDRWIPLAMAMNSLNRSMGLSDFYPFVVSAPAAEKLDFIHQVIKSAAAQ